MTPASGLGSHAAVAAGGLMALLASLPAAAQAQAAIATLTDVTDPQPFTADDLLWMEVRSGEEQLAESVNVYASRAGVFVPIGELSRVLDLAVGVFPAQGRAEGWVLSRDRSLVIDLVKGEALLAGQSAEMAPGEAVIYADDLYLRIDLIERLLPVRLRPDTSAQVLELTPLEPLPFQQRLERDRRQGQLETAPRGDAPVQVETPYRLFSPPAFDVNIGGLIARDGAENADRYDVRMAGDLLWAGLEAYVGSDDDGRASEARIMLSRRDAGGRALGPLGGTEVGIGDVFTPSLALGAGSTAGRGVFYTSAPRDSFDIGTPLDLRGELAVGDEVELYINEVLYSARSTPVQGRYEFLNVPLAYGLNTLRLVFYGPHGETRSEVRRINFGSGQVEAGRLVVRFGAVAENLTVFTLGDRVTQSEDGAARVVASADYGLTAGLTLSGGLARYSPGEGDARSVGALGLRGAFGPVATQADFALDDTGGKGLSLGFAARPGGISLVGRHAEYRGGFIDETRQPGGSDIAPLLRASDLRADTQLTVPGGLTLPLALSMRRLERIDGSRVTNFDLRASAPINRFYVSSSVGNENERRADGTGLNRWVGASDIATLVAARLQLRAGVSYSVSPDPALESGYATADWQLSETRALRLGIVHSLQGRRQTSLQASHVWRTGRFDLAVNGAWESEGNNWRVGLQLGFGFGYNPGRKRYQMIRPGGASGGAVAVDAFVDQDGDGLRQPGEEGVAGIVVDTPGGEVTTDGAGRAFTSGLGDPGTTVVRLDAASIEDPFLVGGPGVYAIEPRPGRTATISWPMRRSTEVELTVLLDRPGEAARPLAAVNLELTPSRSGAIITVRSDHAGVAFIEAIPPGTYAIRLQPAQAAALGLSLSGNPTLTIPPSGGFVRGDPLRVTVGPTAAAGEANP